MFVDSVNAKLIRAHMCYANLLGSSPSSPAQPQVAIHIAEDLSSVKPETTLSPGNQAAAAETSTNTPEPLPTIQEICSTSEVQSGIAETQPNDTAEAHPSDVPESQRAESIPEAQQNGSSETQQNGKPETQQDSVSEIQQNGTETQQNGTETQQNGTLEAQQNGTSEAQNSASEAQNGSETQQKGTSEAQSDLKEQNSASEAQQNGSETQQNATSGAQNSTLETQQKGTSAIEQKDTSETQQKCTPEAQNAAKETQQNGDALQDGASESSDADTARFHVPCRLLSVSRSLSVKLEDPDPPTILPRSNTDMNLSRVKLAPSMLSRSRVTFTLRSRFMDVFCSLMKGYLLYLPHGTQSLFDYKGFLRVTSSAYRDYMSKFVETHIFGQSS